MAYARRLLRGLRFASRKLFLTLLQLCHIGCFAGPKSLWRDLATMGNSRSFLTPPLQFMREEKSKRPGLVGYFAARDRYSKVFTGVTTVNGGSDNRADE